MNKELSMKSDLEKYAHIIPDFVTFRRSQLIIIENQTICSTKR